MINNNQIMYKSQSTTAVYSIAGYNHQRGPQHQQLHSQQSTTAKGPPTIKKRKLVTGIDIKPSDYALAAFRANGAVIDKVQQAMEPTFQLPTQEMLDGYKPELMNLVRQNDLAGLKQVFANGKLVNCCNKFGESLLHLACRRGRTEVVKFFLEEAGIGINIRDDYLRTPIHDACWTSEPNFELVDLLIRHAPEHVVLSDVRGFTPFDYVRKEHKGKWLRFLWERRSILKPASSTPVAASSKAPLTLPNKSISFTNVSAHGKPLPPKPIAPAPAIETAKAC